MATNRALGKIDTDINLNFFVVDPVACMRLSREIFLFGTVIV